ncbi:chaplin [Streptomyces sp. NPDC002133]|uniref:chaplin n=1 Tax=Streptomyces sp. NPDC002133 TaxID=3154409 RepID=UPI00332298E1
MRMRTLAATVGLTAAALFGGAGAAVADNGAEAIGATWYSGGVLSGNVVQVPVSVPVNLCGNAISVLGLLNPAVGNACSNG